MDVIPFQENFDLGLSQGPKFSLNYEVDYLINYPIDYTVITPPNNHMER